MSWNKDGGIKIEGVLKKFKISRAVFLGPDLFMQAEKDPSKYHATAPFSTITAKIKYVSLLDNISNLFYIMYMYKKKFIK